MGSKLNDRLNEILGKQNDDDSEEIDANTPPPKPDDAMFYGLVGDVARAAALDSEVNPVAAAMNFLSFLGANVGRDVYMRVGNTWHHPRVYTLGVGRSSRGRKGDSQSLVHRIRKRIDEVYSGTLGQTHSGGLSSREGLAFMIHDGYREGKREVEAIKDKRLWVIESEFANILHQAKRDGNTLSAALRDAWDGVSIKPAIKNSRVWASRPHIGLACSITPGELLDLIERRELTNGFANRFLTIWAERTCLVPFPKATPNNILNQLVDRTASVITFARGKYPDESDTREIRLSEAARQRYEAAYRKELNRPEASDLLTALLDRRAPYALRLAMLFALTDKSLTIQTGHLEAALAWVRYARDSVQFIFSARAGIAQAEEKAEIARKILAFLRDKEDGADRTEIHRKCFGAHVSSPKIDEAINGMLIATPPPIELIEMDRPDGKNGRKRKIYRALCAHSANRDGAWPRPNAQKCAVCAVSNSSDQAQDLSAQSAQKCADEEIQATSLTAQCAQSAHRYIEESLKWTKPTFRVIPNVDRGTESGTVFDDGGFEI